MTLSNKLDKLKNILRQMHSVVIAYSGGVDSTLLLKVAKDVLKNNVLAVIAKSPTYPYHEIKQAKKQAKNLKVKQLIIETHELKNPCFVKNPLKRCFFCKEELFSKLKLIARKHNLKYVCDGSNFDDLKDFRPGSIAKKKLAVRSPLQEAKLTKDDIRRLSYKLKLSTWNKPSFACLASRFPYGTKITKDNLSKIEIAEEFLKNLGFKQVRLRHHKNIARIEVPKDDIQNALRYRRQIVENLKEIGYNYICLDLEGYRSGSMNIK